MSNNIIYIYFNNSVLTYIFNELYEEIKKKYGFQIIKLEDLSKIKSKGSFICDNITIKELKKNKNLVINSYLINEGDVSNSFTEDIVNTTVFRTPFKITDILNYIITDQKSKENELKDIIKFNKISYDFRKRQIYSSVTKLKLTEKENDIFFYLLQLDNRPVSKKVMLENIWSYNSEIDTHTLETHIYLIRKKLEKSFNIKDVITNQEDFGYILNKNKL